jgi:hypothetical protein
MEKTVFIRSTRERRAEILVIKQMIDEAHRFRESWDLEAYANLMADIEIARVKLDPQSIDKISQAEETAAYYRSCAKPPKRADSNWLKRRFAFLDDQLRSVSRILVYFENQIRVGFEHEMLGGDVLKFTKWI